MLSAVIVARRKRRSRYFLLEARLSSSTPVTPNIGQLQLISPNAFNLENPVQPMSSTTDKRVGLVEDV